jgi:hypothetical protein
MMLKRYPKIFDFTKVSKIQSSELGFPIPDLGKTRISAEKKII